MVNLIYCFFLRACDQDSRVSSSVWGFCWFGFGFFFLRALHLGHVKKMEKTLSTLLVLFFGGDNWKTLDSNLFSHTAGWKAIRFVPFPERVIWLKRKKERQQGKMVMEKITEEEEKWGQHSRKEWSWKTGGKSWRHRVKGNCCLKSNGSIWSPRTGTPDPHRVLISFHTLGQK